MTVSFRASAAAVFTLAVGLLLASNSPTVAQTSCSQTRPASLDVRLVAPPELADSAAITDVLHALTWTWDLRDLTNLRALFTDDLEYEACTLAGLQIVRTTTADELVSFVNNEIYAFLQNRLLRTRHFLANQVLDAKVLGNGDVLATIAMLVTIQSDSIDDLSLDYTATVLAVLTREDGVWKIAKLTVFTDQPYLFLARAR